MTEALTKPSQNNAPPNSAVSLEPQENWFLDSVHRRLHLQNKNLLGLVVGEVGEGKTYFALRTAERVDPEFSVDQVCFTPRQFIRQVRTLERPGAVIVLDDAGLAAPHREWQSQSNKILSYVFESFRFKRFFVMSTLPLPNLTDYVNRGLSHLMVRLIDRGFAVVYRVLPNYFSSSPPYRTKRLGIVRASMPSEPLWKVYEERRALIMDERYGEYEKKLSEPSEERGLAKSKLSRADEILEQIKGNPVPYLDGNGKMDYRKLMSAFNCSTNVAYTVIDRFKELPTGPP